MMFSTLATRRWAALGATCAAALTAATLCAAQTPPPAAAGEPTPATVLATVDGAPITAGEVALATEDLQQSLASMTEPQRRDYALNYLIDLKIAARAADKQKIGEGEAFGKRMVYLKDRALMEELLQVASKAAVTDETVKRLYDETAKNLKPEEEVRASHILVPTEDEANKVEERLAKGEDFAAVAKEVSKDPGSGAQGGDLGFFGRDQMVPPFAEAAFTLEPGKLSKPVKTQFGFHVIKVAEKRERPIPPLEQVRPQIESYVVRTAQQDLILKLRSEAKVERTAAATPAPAAEAPEGVAPAPAEAPKP